MRPALAPALLLLAAAALAGDGDVSGARALEIVKTLAGDAMEGRKSGLESGIRTEAWMAEQVAAMGLARPNGFTYFHEFKASVTEDGPGPLFEILGGGREPRQGSFLSDYVALLFSGRGTVEAEVVFAGFGIRAPERGRDDYEGLDVKGRIVMAVRGRPEGSLFDEERTIGYKSATAADLGAVGFLLVEGDQAVPGTIQEKYHRADLPAVWLSRAAADDLLGRAGKGNLASHVRALQEGGRASFPLTGVTARLSINSRLLADRPLRNVVGLWPGETDEYVVLGAHLDHVGKDAAGNIYNGADDNASGSAMLHEVARAIAAQGRRFRRGILFVWFAGEEQGLLGSWAFVKAPPVPLEKIAVMINTDMVGQGTAALAVGGAEAYPREAAALGNLAFEGFEVKPFRAEPNSDHYPFQASGVPAFFVHTQGAHPNYHQPADDWANIKPELLETAARFVRRAAETAADADAPLCRPLRKEEYLWNDAPVVDLFGDAPREGVDVRVGWFEGSAERVLGEIDAELARLERKDAPEALLPKGPKAGAVLAGLRPARVLGLRGDLHAARRLGVLLFAPPPGRSDGLMGKADVVVWLRGDEDPASFPGPILLPAARARALKERLRARTAPWLAVVRLSQGAEAEIRAAVAELGIDHVLVVPGDAPAPPVIAALGMGQAELRPILGANFVRMIEALP